jgi:hypothetical protein
VIGMRTLPHPPEAETDKNSLEMIRGWIVNGELQISLAAWVWTEKPDEWGRLLADSANHLADAIADQTGKERSEIYKTICRALIKHLNEPPEDLVGDFVE